MFRIIVFSVIAGCVLGAPLSLSGLTGILKKTGPETSVPTGKVGDVAVPEINSLPTKEAVSSVPSTDGLTDQLSGILKSDVLSKAKGLVGGVLGKVTGLLGKDKGKGGKLGGVKSPCKKSTPDCGKSTPPPVKNPTTPCDQPSPPSTSCDTPSSPPDDNPETC